MTGPRLLCFAALLASLLAWGCSAYLGVPRQSEIVSGRAFNYEQIPSLVLGQTSPQEARARFGEPKAERSVSNEFNDYQVLQYIFVRLNPSTGREEFRVLTLEFVDETLNGYLYGTSHDNDLGFRNPSGKSSITRQVSTPEDVLAAMGQPDGKAYYTTTITAFAEGSGEEIWLWREAGLDQGTQTEKSTLVGFDRDGVVDNVTTSKIVIN